MATREFNHAATCGGQMSEPTHSGKMLFGTAVRRVQVPMFRICVMPERQQEMRSSFFMPAPMLARRKRYYALTGDPSQTPALVWRVLRARAVRLQVKGTQRPGWGSSVWHVWGVVGGAVQHTQHAGMKFAMRVLPLFVCPTT